MIPTKAILEIIEFQIQVGNAIGILPLKFHARVLPISSKIRSSREPFSQTRKKVLRRCGPNAFLKTRIWTGVSWIFIFLSITKFYHLFSGKSSYFSGEKSKLEFLASVAFHIYELSMSSILVMANMIYLESSEELCQAVNSLEGLGKYETKGNRSYLYIFGNIVTF